MTQGPTRWSGALRVVAPTPEEAVLPSHREGAALERDVSDAFRFFGHTGRAVARTPQPEASADTRNDALAAADEESLDGAWRVRWVMARQDGRLVVRGLTIEPTDRATPLGGVTANLLRELKPAEVTKAVAAQVGRPMPAIHEAEDMASYVLRSSEAEAAQVQPVADAAPKAGRPPLTDQHLAQVAEAYFQELSQGRGLLGRLGKRFDRTPEAMRDQVAAARKRGFITAAVKAGRAGGEPGPRLLEMRRDQSSGEK